MWLTKTIFINIALVIGLNCNSQTIIGLLDKNTLDFDSERPIKEVYETFSGKKQTIFTYDRNGKLISKVPRLKSIPNFSIFWEYTDSLQKFRTDIKETNFGKMINYFSYHYDNSGYLTSIKYLNPEKKLINDIIIKNDSLGNPIRLETFDNKRRKMGYEVAKYFYDLNLVEIMVYNTKDQIAGIILNPIDKKKPMISLKDYLSKNSYNHLKQKAKDWANLRVTYNKFKYKFNKNGFWKKETHDVIGYFPATKRIENYSNGYITRNIKKYYNKN